MNVPIVMGIPEHEFRLVFGGTTINFDPNKEGGNRKKHKYSLESAVFLLKNLVSPFGQARPHIITDSFLENGEVRHMHLSVDDSSHVVLMVTTMRPNEFVRVISFRRANIDERELFAKHTGYLEPLSA